MSRTRPRFLLAVAAMTAAFGIPARGQVITGPDGVIARHNPFHAFDPSRPLTVAELSKWIDKVGEELRDDGLVVVKQPDVFSQARLTRFRTDFEGQMSQELGTFHLVLAARINRLDAATTTSQTALAGALSSGGGSTTVSVPPLPTLPASTATGPATAGQIGLPLDGGPFTSPTGIGLGANTLAGASALNGGALAIGVEPTVYLDEKKRFLEHLNQIRRINLGPDQNDSSGYGLYLVRLPVSITPGECTYHGHGADLSVQVEHEFPPEFLATTFENLVINDLVDELGPFVYELIRSGGLARMKQLEDARLKKNSLTFSNRKRVDDLLGALSRAWAKEMAGQLPLPTPEAGEPDVAPDADPVDPIASPLLSFILRDDQEMTNDPAKDRPTWLAIADRLDRLADYRAKYQSSFAAYRARQAANLDDFRRRVRLVRENQGLDPTLKPEAREYLRFILRKLLDSANADAVAGALPGTTVDQVYSDGFRDLIGALYATALPDDYPILDKLLHLDAGLTKKYSAPLAAANQALGTLIDPTIFNINPSSTRSAKQLYPIPPRELIRFFLEKNVYRIARDAQEALRTDQPRANEIRAYLRHTLQDAYRAMSRVTNRPVDPPLLAPLADRPFVDSVLEAIHQRQFQADLELPGELDRLSDGLQARVEVTRDNIRKNPIGALCWAIAVDAAVLDEALRRDAAKVFEANGYPCELVGEARFYLPRDQPNDLGRAIFNDYVKVRWPIITFSLDPVTDQQNVADSYNLKRDLQLAVSFAFATGQIGFNQLNSFRRQIEQSSDAIALNRTVTGFTHGNDVFGFRFTPRFQNPPNQRTNLGVIASQLIGGGPGPDYQAKKSKLEAGIREQTAVLLIPTFLPTLRMNVSSNWFKLTDPEHLVYHTDRSMEQGRKVQELRKAVLDACSAQQYRGADLRVLQSKLAQLEAMLPMQSKVVQLPFDNAANGFDLFSEGSTALVPELTGFTGVDVIRLPTPAVATPGATTTTTQAPAPAPSQVTTTSALTVASTTTTASSGQSTLSTVGGMGSIADVFVTGKYLSLLDTKAIAGGRSAAFEILSREVVHVQVPANVIPTLTEDGKTYVEIYLSTPNGISNSILVPCALPPAAPTPAPKAAAAFDLDPATRPIDVFYQWLATPGNPATLIPTADPRAAIAIKCDPGVAVAPKNLLATFTVTVGTQAVTLSLPTADMADDGTYAVDVRSFVSMMLDKLATTQTSTPAPLAATGNVAVVVQPFLLDPGTGLKANTAGIKLPTTLNLNLINNATGSRPPAPPVPPPPGPGPSGKPTGFRSPDPAEGPRDPALVRTAAQLPGGFTLPPLPASSMVPRPPELMTVPTMLPPSASAEAEQVARLLTGQPMLPNAQAPTPAGLQALAPVLAAERPASPSTLPPLPAAGPASPIIVMPAPVVVVPAPKPAAKKRKGLFHSFKLFNRDGQRIDP